MFTLSALGYNLMLCEKPNPRVLQTFYRLQLGSVIRHIMLIEYCMQMMHVLSLMFSIPLLIIFPGISSISTTAFSCFQESICGKNVIVSYERTIVKKGTKT